MPIPYQKTFSIIIVLLIGLFFRVSLEIYGQSIGYKYLRNYSYEEYDHQAQNWGMVQAENGLIYVANQGGVLEFDGVSWRVIYLPELTLRSLTIDKFGTVYMGGNNRIWYLAPDAADSLRYMPIPYQIKEEYKNFGNVWSTLATKEGIFFRTTKFLFRWDYKTMKVFETIGSFQASFVYNGELYVQEKGKGLFKMVKDSITLIPGGETFAGKKVYVFVPYGSDTDSPQVLIGTRSNGFYRYDGKAATPFLTEVDDYLKVNMLSHGIRLSSGDFALATLRGGLVVMTPGGGLKHIFDKTYGLQDNNVKSVFQDVQGNLWLCLAKGISKIEYTSPISFYDERSNLPGLILSVVSHENALYVGTNNGLHYLESSLTFRLIPGIPDKCWSLLSTENSLLAATSGGVFQVEPDIKQRVIQNPSYVLQSSLFPPGRVWCGTSNGLVALSRKNGQWIEERRIEFIGQEIRSIAEDKNGRLWLGTLAGGIFRVESPVNAASPVVTRYGSSHGLPEKEIYVASVAGHITFASTEGLFRFDEKNEMFIPDLTLGPEFAGGSKHVFRITEGKNEHIWFHSKSRNYQAIPLQGGAYKINGIPFLRIPVTAQVNTIYPTPDGKTTWFASYKGLIRYDTTTEKNYRQNFQTLIRRVLVNEKQVNEKKIFDGYKNKSVNGVNASFPIFEYKDRNLRFEFAAPFFEAETETLYSYFLEGYDNGWSIWDKETQKNYTNLNAGLYKFRVRAKNVYGHGGKEDIFQFKIKPPWYLTWCSYIIYALLLLGVISLVVKWRSVRLEKENQQLEQVVKEKTGEVYHQNQLLEEQSQKLKEMDRAKSRFFANISHEFRTPLTLIMNPIEQMLSESSNKLQRKKLNVMLRNSQRLLTLINQLLDLAQLDSGQMKLQASYQDIVPFLKGIVSSFHDLALKKRLNLEFHPEKDGISIYFDPGKMEDAMYNLLINSVKFTPPGGSITVSVFKEREAALKGEANPEGYIKISIRDTGIGISPEQMVHIFDRFYQAGELTENNHKGTGIGLALTKEIILLHHGTIDAHSREGEGTEFEIRLPVGNKHLLSGETVIGSESPFQLQKNKEVETLYIEMEEEEAEEDEVKHDRTHEDKLGERQTAEQEKNLILVVEDNTDVRKYIRDSLVESNYAVVEAGDGKEGIKKAKELIPDLIVSDIMMPKADGFQLSRELKKDVTTSHIPIILLTAKASKKSIIRGLETGADDYITKPFNTQILLTRIKNLIDLRQQLQLKIQRQKMLLPDEIVVSSVDDTFLKEFQDIIEKNLSDPELDIELLCQKLYMGRSTLFRKVQALTGESPKQFILSYRLERAAQLLKANTGNITEVAMATGFASSQHFAKCFKDKFFQTPSDFKASETKA